MSSLIETHLSCSSKSTKRSTHYRRVSTRILNKMSPKYAKEGLDMYLPTSSFTRPRIGFTHNNRNEVHEQHGHAMYAINIPNNELIDCPANFTKDFPNGDTMSCRELHLVHGSSESHEKNMAYFADKYDSNKKVIGTCNAKERKENQQEKTVKYWSSLNSADSEGECPFATTTETLHHPDRPKNKSLCHTECEKDSKTTITYISLIAKAILSSPNRRLVLKDIYLFVSLHFPEICNRGIGWRNSIRHNLSLNNCFEKVGRSPNGKGHYWGISASSLPEFLKGNFRRKRSSKYDWRKPFQQYAMLQAIHANSARTLPVLEARCNSVKNGNVQQDGIRISYQGREQHNTMEMPLDFDSACRQCNTEYRLQWLTQNPSYSLCCDSYNRCTSQILPGTNLCLDKLYTRIPFPCQECYRPSISFPFPYSPNLIPRPTSSCTNDCSKWQGSCCSIRGRNTSLPRFYGV